MGAVFSLFDLTLALFDLGSGVVGCVWLAFLGQWILIGVGFLGVLISDHVLAFALFPGFAIGLLGEVQAKKGNTVGFLLLVVSAIWLYIIMTISSVGIFYFVLHFHSHGPLWPYLFWAYTIVTGIWISLVGETPQKNQGAISTITAFAACLGSIAIIGSTLIFDSMQIQLLLTSFMIPAGVCQLIQIVLLLQSKKQTSLS